MKLHEYYTAVIAHGEIRASDFVLAINNQILPTIPYLVIISYYNSYSYCESSQ